jgi:ATP-binding cassette subfamily C protein
MKKYLFKSKGLLFLNLIFAIITSALGVYFAFILGKIVDVSVSGDFLEFKNIILTGIILMVISAIFSYLIRIFSGLYIKSTMSNLKGDVFNSILSIGKFVSINNAI